MKIEWKIDRSDTKSIVTFIKKYSNGAVENRIDRNINFKNIKLTPDTRAVESRLLLQTMGLTKYEIPVDSFVSEWLNDFGFPVRLSSNALQDRHFYHFVSEGIQLLCNKAGIYPCVLDAAIHEYYRS